MSALTIILLSLSFLLLTLFTNSPFWLLGLICLTLPLFFIDTTVSTVFHIIHGECFFNYAMTKNYPLKLVLNETIKKRNYKLKKFSAPEDEIRFSLNAQYSQRHFFIVVIHNTLTLISTNTMLAIFIYIFTYIITLSLKNSSLSLNSLIISLIVLVLVSVIFIAAFIFYIVESFALHSIYQNWYKN